MIEHPIFHNGELHLQKLSGVDEVANKLSKMIIVDFLPDQHRAFYPLLNTLFIASIDKAGLPWASIIIGNPGFISTPDNKHLNINAQPISGDVLTDNIQHNKFLGLLGMEYQTRRRNRAVGELVFSDDSDMSIRINQALGNCPKYIQARKAIVIDSFHSVSSLAVEESNGLSEECQKIIQQANTFFIASYHPETERQGADISHRGGKPGFVRIINDDALLFNDFSGNNLYMTLGNLFHYPHAGLLFINYRNGDLWQLQCEAEIIETPKKTHSRQIKMKVNRVRKIPQALNIKWEFIDYSRFL